ncbi:MAG: dihydrofolate reductase family protein [Hyphomonadaceae bacterium]|nr:dihydrofolate reductase family protein [Hyphomonadaceae bacterium]
MRPLRYSINITLDGCADHRAGVPDEELHAYSAETIARADALIFGRVMYGLMEAGWREPSESGVRPDGMAEWMMPFARAIGGKKKYVVSSTFESTGWNAEPIRPADLEATVRRLKDEPGNGLYTAGVTLPRALAELGLIDEYEFWVQPRIAGHGPTPFVGLPRHIELKFTGHRGFASGAVALRYEPRR